MTVKIGYYVAHEQFAPDVSLENVVLAEKQGFDSVWTSDHFHPWVHTGSKISFAWVWIAAAAERTNKISIGPGVTAPILRYHPAIVAQAFATLGVMYPRRIFLGVGTGEALNDVPLGYDWPSYSERAERLEEAIKIMKLLWTKSFVNFKGRYYSLRKANLYLKPEDKIPLYVAASGPNSARIAGEYADGILTLSGFKREFYTNVLFPAVERGAKTASRDPDLIERCLELCVSYDKDYNKALDSTMFWAATSLPMVFKYAIYDPREIEENARMVGREKQAEAWFIGTTPEEHIKLIEDYIKLGFTNIHVQSSSPDERKFIKIYGEKVIPYLKETYAE